MAAAQILGQLLGNADPIGAFAKGAQLRAALDGAAAQQQAQAFDMLFKNIRRNDENRQFEAKLAIQQQQRQDDLLLDQQKMAETARVNDSRIGFDTARINYYNRRGTGAEEEDQDFVNAIYPQGQQDGATTPGGIAPGAAATNPPIANASDFAKLAEDFKTEHGVLPDEAVATLAGDTRPDAVKLFNKARGIMAAGKAVSAEVAGPQTPQADKSAYQQQGATLGQLAATKATQLLPSVDANTEAEMRTTPEPQARSAAALAAFEKQQTGGQPGAQTDEERMFALMAGAKVWEKATPTKKSARGAAAAYQRGQEELAGLMAKTDPVNLIMKRATTFDEKSAELDVAKDPEYQRRVAIANGGGPNATLYAPLVEARAAEIFNRKRMEIMADGFQNLDDVLNQKNISKETVAKAMQAKQELMDRPLGGQAYTLMRDRANQPRLEPPEGLVLDKHSEYTDSKGSRHSITTFKLPENKNPKDLTTAQLLNAIHSMTRSIAEMNDTSGNIALRLAAYPSEKAIKAGATPDAGARKLLEGGEASIEMAKRILLDLHEEYNLRNAAKAGAPTASPSAEPLAPTPSIIPLQTLFPTK